MCIRDRSQFSSGLLSNPLAGELNPDLGILPTNIVLAGGIGGKLGIKPILQKDPINQQLLLFPSCKPNLLLLLFHIRTQI